MSAIAETGVPPIVEEIEAHRRRARRIFQVKVASVWVALIGSLVGALWITDNVDLEWMSEWWLFITTGAPITILLSVVSMLIATALAIAGALARISSNAYLNGLASLYVSLVRGTPLVVQIFFIFFALPQLGIRLDGFTVAWLAVMVWGGAFNSENFRAGFEAVPQRYREAGHALGFRPIATFLNVTLPIGGRIALPPSINTYISVLKNTSLVYVIGYEELTTTALNINALSPRTLETFGTLAVCYLVVVWTLSALIRLLEGHLALPREGR